MLEQHDRRNKAEKEKERRRQEDVNRVTLPPVSDAERQRIIREKEEKEREERNRREEELRRREGDRPAPSRGNSDGSENQGGKNGGNRGGKNGGIKGGEEDSESQNKSKTQNESSRVDTLSSCLGARDERSRETERSSVNASERPPYADRLGEPKETRSESAYESSDKHVQKR